MIDIEITGESDMADALRSLPARISKEAAFDALVIAVQPLIAAARANAPVDSGSLQQSIGLRLVRYKKGMQLFAVVGPRRGFGKGGREPANYAHLVEFGHRINRGKKTLRKGGVSSGEVAPKPFLRPAWDANKQEVLDTLSREFAERLEVVVRRRRGDSAA